MNKKFTVLLFTSICLGFLTFSLYASPPVQEETTIDGDKKQDTNNSVKNNEDKTKPSKKDFDFIEGKVTVSLIGANAFKDNDYVLYEESNWKNDVNRFILISNDIKIDANKQKTIQQWIEDEKVVMFYGENVIPNKAKDKLGVDFEVYEMESLDNKILYLLYGYGSFNSYESNMPIFLASNSSKNLEEKINQFLYEKRNF